MSGRSDLQVEICRHSRHLVLGRLRSVVLVVAVRTPVAARLGARTKRLAHDLLDGAGAPAALGAAPKTAVNLPGGARNFGSGGHGAADVMVAQDVARTDNHEGKQLSGEPLMSI